MIIFFTLLSIVGAIYVAKGKSLIANILWSISNIAFIWHNILILEYEMVLLFVTYEFIALYGIYNLKFRKKKNGI